MDKFIELTVAFAKDQTRKELINASQIVRIIGRASGGCAVCFNSTGSDYIEVKESMADIEKLLS